MKVAGIDPGAKGALVLVDDSKLLKVLDFDEVGIRGYSLILKHHRPDLVVIEQVHSMPGQGVKSMFTFGQRFGEIVGMVNALDLNHIFLSPQIWRKKLDIQAKATKHDIANFISSKFPSLVLKTERGRLIDGRSDAACLALYGLNNIRMINNEPITI